MGKLSVSQPAASGRSGLSHALLSRATSQKHRGDRAACREALTAAIPLDPTPAARYCLAEFLAEAGDLSGAIQLLGEAWELARRIESPEWRADCCHALAEIHRTRGDCDLANRYRQWAIRAELDAGRDVDAAVWLHDRAADALANGDIEAADALLTSVTRLAPSEPDVQAQVQANRGVVSTRLGRWSQGIRWLVRAFQTLKAQGDLRGCADVVLRVGCILQMQGEWRRAIPCFVRSAQVFRRLQAVDALRQSERYLSECRRMLAAIHGDPCRN